MADVTTGGAAAGLAVPDRRTQVGAAWAAALKHDNFGPDDDFFDVVGGHSLLVAGIMAQLSRQCGRRLSLRLFFDNPSVNQLAAALDAVAAPADQHPS